MNIEGRRLNVIREHCDHDCDNNNADNSKVPFEAALDKAGFGLYSWLLTTLNGLSIIAFACIVYSTTVTTPTSKCELKTSSSMERILVPAPVVAAVLGAIPWGYLADKYGRRHMLLYSFASSTIFNTIASISVNPTMLLVLQFSASLMASGQYSITMSLLSECVPAARRNLVVLIVASTFMLSVGIMALISIPIMPLTFSTYLPALGIYWNSWRSALLIYGLPGAICFVWMFFMQESPKFSFAKKGEAEALKILKKIHRINHFNSKEEFLVKGLVQDNPDESFDEGKSKSQIKELFKGKLLKYLIIMTTLSMFQQVGSFMVWLPSIAENFMEHMKGEGTRDLNLCGLITATAGSNSTTCVLHEDSLLVVFGVGVLQAMFNIFVILVVGKFGRRNMVMAIAAACGASGVIVNLVSNAVASVIFFVIFLLGIVVIGLYAAISVVLFPTHLRALAISLMMAGGRVVLFATAQIVKKLFENNCALSFYIFASMFAASALIVSFVPDERRYINNTKECEEIETVELRSRIKSEIRVISEAHCRVSILA